MSEENIYTVQEIAAEWKLSEKVIRRLVKDDPDVMKLYGPGLLMGTAKRVHVTLRIPESVVIRIREQLTKPVPKPVLTIEKRRPIRRIPRAGKAA
jgi:hypothetical protein